MIHVMEEKVQIGGVYNHFKGRRYKVKSISRSCDSGNRLLVTYLDLKEETLWTRDFDEFIEIHSSGEKRFTFVF